MIHSWRRNAGASSGQETPPRRVRAKKKFAKRNGEVTPEQQQSHALQMVAHLRDMLQKGGGNPRSHATPRSRTLNPLGVDGDLLDVHSDQHPGAYGELTYMLLERMGETEFVSAVIGTRCHQVASFCRPSEDEMTPGFRVLLRDRSARKKMNRRLRRRAEELAQWMFNCGEPGIHETPIRLDTLTRMVMRDSLTFEQLAMELVRTSRRGRLCGFVPVDAKTIRRASITAAERAAGRRDPQRGYVQVIDGQVYESFAESDMIFGVRNPQTDIERGGYGNPEIWTALGSIMGLLRSEMWNQSNFATGVQAAGIIALVSAMDDPAFSDFEEKFYSMLSGVAGAKRMPLVQLDPDDKESLQHIDLSKANREMEYSQWNMWLMKKILMAYHMDPSELGFLFGNEGVTSSLNQQGPAERVAYSRERGLRPLLDFWGRILNRILEEVDDRFVLEWTGLDVDSPEARLEARVKKGANYWTINRMLEDEGEEPIDAWWANCPNNSTILQAEAGRVAQEQMQQGQGEEEGQQASQPAGQGDAQEGDDLPDMDFDIDALFGGSALGKKEAA